MAGVNAAFELKIVKHKAMPFKQVREHQIVALKGVKWNGTYHKINDIPFMPERKGTFANPKPFDCFHMANGLGYIVVLFYKPREKKEMIWIDVEEFEKEMKVADRKSLTEKRAKEIGKVISL